MLEIDKPNSIRITTAPGLVEFLQHEVIELGYTVDEAYDTTVALTGTLRDCMRLNLRLRTAIAVHYLLGAFPCGGPEELYANCIAISWEEIVPLDEYVCVDSRGDHPSIDNWMFVNQRVKDAIVDRIEERYGARPESGPDRHAIVINVYWKNDQCSVSLNTSGAKLSDRGYRKIPLKAPMVETLAAGVVMATGYDGSVPFVNPMCGSGTLAIEAALSATGRAPGLLRSNYGLMHVKGFDAEAWRRMRVDEGKSRRKNAPAKIIASDIDPKAVAAATQNAKTAGVDHLIEFVVCDFGETPVPSGPGIVVLNPEYGLRLGVSEALERTYKRIGDFFKQKCPGYTGYIFTGSKELAKRVGLRTSRKIPFWNAKIECRLLKYELYTGTRDAPVS
ncbi:MAG: RNA methyltransferase [Planctomycetota bacterium]|nr:MAG: RNA methyltransferase [Planctomycetota bacterium]